MGHRHTFRASQMFGGDHDRNWNPMHAEQPYLPLASSVAADGSFYYPMENISLNGVQFSSHCDSGVVSTGYSSSIHRIEAPHYQPDGSGPSHDPLQHPSTAGASCGVPEGYAQHGSSSNYEGHSYHGVDGGLADPAVGSGRGHHKRKSPGIPSAGDRGSTSRYYHPGSSSDLPISSELFQDKRSMDSQYMHWDDSTLTPSYRSNGLSIGGEGSMRNVRSCSVFNLESNLSRTHLSSNPSHHSHSTSPVIDYSSTVNIPGPHSNNSTQEWNPVRMSHSHGRFLGPDTSGLSHEINNLPMGSSAGNPSVDFWGYQNDHVSNRNLIVPQGFHGNPTQSARGVRSRFPQRTCPALRASSSNLRLGNGVPSDDGCQFIHSSRHPRPASTVGLRNLDRNWRSRMSHERYRSISDVVNVRDRLSSEGSMVVDRSSLFGSRSLLDQHRDLRLDIDEMSYEDLLDLGEIIGNVNTGLSEDSISKCLTETIYRSSNPTQEEGNCAICLEEYKDMDDIGELKTCRHGYHSSCVKKWLSLKNSCPICKASALPDSMKE